MGFKVTAGAVVAKVGDSERYFYRGQSLSGVEVKESRRLQRLGLVSEVKDPAPEPEPDESEGDQSADEGKRQDDGGQAKPGPKKS